MFMLIFIICHHVEQTHFSSKITKWQNQAIYWKYVKVGLLDVVENNEHKIKRYGNVHQMKAEELL